MASSKTWETLDERAQILLRVLVDRYIREGNPVGSRTLSRDSGLELSPATIRNVMADLEDLGFIESPHTSAGRIPTNKGYRFFVDTLVRLTPPAGDDITLLEERLAEVAGNPQALALSVSSLLSGVTRLAGVVTVPRRPQMALRQIEFLPLSGQRVLAILVVNETEVQNKILSVQRDFTESELREAANYLTAQFRGRNLYEVRKQVLRELRETRESMNRGLFEAFSQRRDILHLLDQSLHTEGVQIFIGHESGYRVLDSCSIVAAPYVAADDTTGVLGVIGPTRMAYERVIPIVDITAKLLGRALGRKN
jgi:heat-inducible transcriptional repressor